jgi:hypothetical protein
VTAAVSLAVPVNEGTVLFDGDGGWPKVTVGELVFTSNVTDSLTPLALPSELGWVAIAVYCPLVRAGLALLDVHPPLLGVAVPVETTVPVAVAPW